LITNQPPSEHGRNPRWQGTRDGYHPIVFVFMPIFWEHDFKGSQLTIEDEPNYCWLIVFSGSKGRMVLEYVGSGNCCLSRSKPVFYQQGIRRA